MASETGARVVDLPEEVLLSIFSFLPVADMARCAATCEPWHRIVSTYTSLWKGKIFRSNRSPEECAETRAVLNALPTFEDVSMEPGNSFMVFISYPHIHLSVINIGVIRNCRKLRCETLSARGAIAGDTLFYQMVIDFEGLRHRRLSQPQHPSLWNRHEHCSDYVTRTALDLCLNLRHLSMCMDTLLAEKLGAIKGLCRLQTLEISWSCLEKLQFLRHCSTSLEEFQLVNSVGLMPCKLRELRYLQNLRRLLLSNCDVEEGDLVAAVLALGSLEWMELRGCRLVSDLSFLRRCDRLTEVRFTQSCYPDPLVTASLEGQQLHDLRLPVVTDFCRVPVDCIRLTADDLSGALSTLEDLGLPNSCLAYLSNLRRCTQLRHTCFELVREGVEPVLKNVRALITLTGST